MAMESRMERVARRADDGTCHELRSSFPASDAPEAHRMAAVDDNWAP